MRRRHRDEVKMQQGFFLRKNDSIKFGRKLKLNAGIKKKKTVLGVRQNQCQSDVEEQVK